MYFTLKRDTFATEVCSVIKCQPCPFPTQDTYQHHHLYSDSDTVLCSSVSTIGIITN